MVVVAQTRSGSILPPVVCTCHWEAADRMGRSCGATHPALSAEPFCRSRGLPLSCQ
jgi:hypothetical protein